MSKKSKKQSTKPRIDAAARKGPAAPRWWPFAVLVLAAAIFYWTPLTSDQTSIQWDAVDVHHSAQKYFADRLHEGRLPFWTPYVHSGYPFLADPQVGAWYPLNWPFFLAGISPKSIEAEVALHAVIALTGAYLLALRLFGSKPAALLAALLYAFSGFFTGHSSHVGMFQAAAWLPWLLLAFFRSVEEKFAKYAALAGVCGGLMGLAGHFQTALYGLSTLALAAVAEVARRPVQWKRVLAACGITAVLAALIAGIVIVPGLELTGESVRAHVDTSASRDGALDPRTLGTLAYPNLFGAVEGAYTGPGDITQYYFYAGILLLPLAAVGLTDRRIRLLGLLLVVIPLWYALGPAAGLYRIAGMLPGFHSVRAPVHAWFAAALGLALLAGAGLGAIRYRWPRPALLAAILCVCFADLYYWNSHANQMAYARASFQEIYGKNEALLAQVASSQPPLTRFDAPDKLAALGPMNGPLGVRLEATYGYNPLELAAYADYRAAARSNGRLIDAMNVSRELNLTQGSVEPRPSGLPRAYFPKRVSFAANLDDSRRLLASAAPPESAIVLGAGLNLSQDPAAEVRIVAHDEQSLRLHTRAASASLLRVAVPYFPGWHASTGDSELTLLRTDQAFIGIVVPAGERDILLQFRPRYFGWGAALSLLGIAAVALVLTLAWLKERREPDSATAATPA